MFHSVFSALLNAQVGVANVGKCIVNHAYLDENMAVSSLLCGHLHQYVLIQKWSTLESIHLFLTI